MKKIKTTIKKSKKIFIISRIFFNNIKIVFLNFISIKQLNYFPILFPLPLG